MISLPRVAALGLAALAACASDPTLHVTVKNPSGLAVTKTVVSVYDSKQFTCQDIEYGNVDDVTLQGALVASETVDASGRTGSLAGLSRTDQKLFVARGYDAMGNLLAAGCAAQGVVSGNVTLEIDTEVAATVSISLVDPTGTQDFYGIAATVTDPNGKQLDGRQVWWRVYGAAGTTAQSTSATLNTISDGIWEPAQPTCANNGTVAIHPVPPSTIGGFAVEVRVAWSVAPPQLFSSFTKLNFALTQLAPPATVTSKLCARRVNGSVERLDCLDQPGTSLVAFDFSTSVAGGVVSLSSKGTTTVASPPPPSDTIAVFDVPNPANPMNRDVFAATAHCAVATLFGSIPADPSQGCPTSLADDILVVPACGASLPGKLVFHVAGSGGVTTAADHLIITNATGGGAVDVAIPYKGVEAHVGFAGAGCVTELNPAGGTATLRQVVALDFLNANGQPIGARALYNCSGASCSALELPVPGAGVTFTGGSEARMIAATVDATGVELTQFVLLPDAGGLADHLVERARQPSASVPLQLAVGNFDSDAGGDAIWTMQGRRGTTFEIAYARTVGADPLEALSPAQPVTTSTLEVGDVTGDNYDDIIVTGATIEMVPKKGVAVIPTRVAPPSATLITDRTCNP